jgi:uncharacterized membrane protein
MTTPARIPAVDVARGVALVAMAIYHFAWDLSYFGLIQVEVARDPGWRFFAKSIATTFLMLVGISLVLATRDGIRWRPYARRLAMIAGAAALVTLGTLYAMPATFIYFGILHCIALSSLLGLAFLRVPVAVVLAAAAAVLGLAAFAKSPAFSDPWLLWLGLSPVVPATNDYVPIVPWFAAVLAGIGLARLALPRISGTRLASWTPQAAPGRWLALGGRHSLLVYLVHQPLLIGLLYAVTALTELPAQRGADGFVASCSATCEARGNEAGLCRRTCQCVADDLAGTDLLSLSMERLTKAEESRIAMAVQACRALQAPLPRILPSEPPGTPSSGP